MWLLGIEPRSSGGAYTLISTEPSLWPPEELFFLSPVCIRETSSENCVWIGSLCQQFVCSDSVTAAVLFSVCFLHTIEQELYPPEAGMLGTGGKVSVISKLQIPSTPEHLNVHMKHNCFVVYTWGSVPEIPHSNLYSQLLKQLNFIIN